MPRWFYGAWAIVAVVALTLPIAIPYAVWPRDEAAQPDPIAECGRRAKIDVRVAELPYARFLPLSANVEGCDRPAGDAPTYRAEVAARGPYGIAVASYQVTPQGATAVESGGDWLAFAALLAGVVLTSTPFGVMWIRRRLVRRLQLAV